MQRERDITDTIQRFKQTHDIQGGTFSGGKIDDFQVGWAVYLWGFGKAHYWKRRRFGLARSLCGLVRQRELMYGEGNVPRCKRCQKRRNAVTAASKEMV